MADITTEQLAADLDMIFDSAPGIEQVTVAGSPCRAMIGAEMAGMQVGLVRDLGLSAQIPRQDLPAVSRGQKLIRPDDSSWRVTEISPVDPWLWTLSLTQEMVTL